MAVEIHELDRDGGIVLVCTTSGHPLSVSVTAFADYDEAETFLTWLQPVDVRTLDEDAILSALTAMRQGYAYDGPRNPHPKDGA